MKKILSLLSAVILTACGSAPDDASLSGGGDGGLAASKAGIFGLYDPVAASAVIPFPNDALFSGFKDPTLNIPNSTDVPFVTAANLQDGFSTTASLFTDFIGFVDFNTVAANTLIVDTSTGAVLSPLTDFRIQSSTARDATGAPISAYRSRVLIEPLRPLKPSTRYIVALTTGVKSRDGVNAVAADLFRVVRSGTPVSQQTEPALNNLNSTQKATLEALRSQLVRPVIVGLCGPNPGCAGGVPEANIAIAWSFTTQSVGKTLTAINTGATAKTLGIKDTTLTTQQINPALAPTANVFAGTISVPYYLSAPSQANPTAALTGFWQADATRPDTSASFLGQVPCGAFATGATINGQTATPSVSTTICYPSPVKQSDQTLPVLATVPNANSGRTMPSAGWPVVIFQHGITGNRSQMLAIGPTLASAGFVTLAIDLPLHGIVPTDSAAALRIPGVSERTFDMDLSNNSSGAPGPDGTVDSSGTYFINLSSLITSRDNLRQAVADLITLTKSAPGTIFLNSSGAPTSTTIDGSKIYFVGHSLGGIVGSALLGVNTDIKAATLAMPGGGVAKLLDASKTFGPRISAGLASSGITEGTDNYETFLRFAQTLVDSGDPLNFAVAARASHPIHMIEVINDLVVPNTAEANTGAGAFDRVTLSGFLSGTDPLYRLMGLAVQGPLSVGPSGIPAQAPVTGANLGVVVQFNNGNHGSILDPSGSASNAAVTCEMQKETASFLVTGGTALPIGGTCP